ncbi:Uncharacterized protein FWK35_00030790 [Aphis craccivora]|uniref:Uncharacterized protein n=1 Tax=Aphis craccivora TaxID=307492 RepID=A0A6G0ZCF3_APHCR|nr:Uncharacterized protein FWK35_00030790 [Aphis craccivora]
MYVISHLKSLWVDTYYLYSSKLDIVILLSSDLSISNHINKIYNNTLYTFGLTVLYFSLVCSILEYGSVICNPHQASLINKIERVHIRLLPVIIYKTNTIDTNVEQLQHDILISSHLKRKDNLMICFIDALSL